MTPGEWLVRLASNPQDGEALDGLRVALERKITVRVGDAASAEDVADEATETCIKLITMARAGTLTIDSPEGYLASVARNAANNIFRDLRRQKRLTAAVSKSLRGAAGEPPAEEQAEDADEGYASDLKRVLQMTREHARGRRLERNRAKFDLAFAEMLELAQGASSAEVLDGRIPPVAADDRLAACTNLYQAQCRLRVELDEAVADLRETGRFTDEEARITSDFLQRLVHCQRKPRAGVSMPGDVPVRRNAREQP
jgi:DNA-directed RNA polymerase specialized sigma24 family protein